MLAPNELKPIGQWVKGMIVGYVEKQDDRRRYVLSRRRWFGLHVEPRREFKIRDAIIDLEYGAFCPNATRKVRLIGEKYRECKKAIIPSYVFANFDASDEPWQRDIKHMEGVIRVFSYDERPMPIPDYQIEFIIEAEQRERAGKRRKLETIEAKPGDFCRVKDGPFAGFFGIVIDVDEKHSKIKAELDIFARPTPVEFEAIQLDVVLDSPKGLTPFSRPQYRLLPRSQKSRHTASRS